MVLLITACFREFKSFGYLTLILYIFAQISRSGSSFSTCEIISIDIFLFLIDQTRKKGVRVLIIKKN